MNTEVKEGDLWEEESQIRKKLKELLLNCKNKEHFLNECGQLFSHPEQLVVRWDKKLRCVSLCRFWQTELIYVAISLKKE